MSARRIPAAAEQSTPPRAATRPLAAGDRVLLADGRSARVVIVHEGEALVWSDQRTAESLRGASLAESSLAPPGQRYSVVSVASVVRT